MKTFLSIGSGPGIGYATAERFAQEGFRIVLSARSIEKTQALAEKLIKQGHSVAVHKVDAADPASVAALVAEVEQQYGSLDVLHYNAASIRQASIASQPQDTFLSDLAVNIGGALVATQAAAPALARSGSGALLLTGGGFALFPHPDYLSISIGKAGIRAQALGLFESFKEQNIHVATVTVATFVIPDSKETTDIAQEFWKLYAQPKESWTAEVSYPASA